MCPFNALTLKVDGQEKLPIIEKEGFPQYDMKAEIDDEKCVKCTICEEVCPRDAIDRNVPAYEGTYKGQLPEQKTGRQHSRQKRLLKLIWINAHSAVSAGRSARQLLLKHKEFTAETGKVEGDVVWDETKCDACKVCIEACPEDCITVEREVVSDKIEGKVSIIQDNCCTCTWCSRNCPTEAITVEKLF